VLKVKRFYRKEISDERYLAACDDLLAHAASGRIELEDIEIKDRSVFIEMKALAQKYRIDVSDAFQIFSVKKNYFSRFDSDSKPILITADKELAAATPFASLSVLSFHILITSLFNCHHDERPLPNAIFLLDRCGKKNL
jgi:predicted nucleic acid-binding protein